MRIATQRVGGLDSGPAFRFTFPVASSPTDPGFDGENLYVPLVTSGRVSVVRARTGKLVRTVDLNNSFMFPSSAAYDGVKVWVTTAQGATSINIEDGTWDEYSFGLQNRGIAVSNGYVYVCSPPTSQVFAIPMNTTDGVPARTWTIPTPNGIGADATGAFVSSTSTGTIYRINGIEATALPARITGGQPRRIVMCGSTVVVADGTANKLYSFAADGSGIVASNTLGVAPASTMLYDGSRLIVVTQTGGITAYSLPSFTPEKTAQIDPGTDMAVFDGRNVWIGSSIGNWMEKR